MALLGGRATQKPEDPGSITDHDGNAALPKNLSTCQLLFEAMSYKRVKVTAQLYADGHVVQLERVHDMLTGVKTHRQAWRNLTVSFVLMQYFCTEVDRDPS